MSSAWRGNATLSGEPDIIAKIGRLEDDLTGFDALTRLHFEMEERVLDDIGLDMSRASWVSSCMTAPLAVILDHWGEYNDIYLTAKPPTKVYNTLCRCGFLPHFGHSPQVDGFKSSIPLLRIPKNQGDLGGEFLRKNLAGRSLFPSGVSSAYKKSLLSAFGEAFVNTEMHANTTNLYTCGQYFPQTARLTMSVVDGGRTIPRNVADYLEEPLEDASAIDWAFGEGNTTSTNQYGGDGLWHLRNFVQANKGKLTAVSGHGYWRQSGSKITKTSLDYPFPGTAVLWEINLSDPNSYPSV